MVGQGCEVKGQLYQSTLLRT